ncbi:hypothetical protein AB0K12_40940 [Nonomuraea sp. NPDC049419]|uniref:hypothetical protein n=1 Tax=Nonomuraea sp. NPDC049419 TaxID=3155772 RepID=UPI0034301BCF
MIAALDESQLRQRFVEALWCAEMLRLADAGLVKAHDGWRVADRRCLPESSMDLITASSTNLQEAARTELTTGIVKPAEPHARAELHYQPPAQ